LPRAIEALLLAAAVLGPANFLLVLVNLAAMPRLSRRGGRAGALPRVSVLVPARNEERAIAAGVGSLLALDYPDFEVIVVDDRSTDRTGEILETLRREHPRLTVLAGSDPPPGWLGKPHALFLASRVATGELLLFVDADVRYHPRTLAEAVESLERMDADLLALLPRIEARGFWENVLMPYLLVSFFFGPGFLANWDRQRWLAVGGGAGNLIRRRVYDAVGGHEALRDSVVDDVHLAWRTKRAGHRTRVARADDRIAVRMYNGFGEVWEGFTKNIAYAFNGVLGGALLLLTLAFLLVAVVPPTVLIAALLGLPVAAGCVSLAAVGFASCAAARVVLAAALGDPIWPAVTHPLMAAVWTGLLGRSLFERLVRRRLVWRGRDVDARSARF
jgi:chlorobactene glucosyltransferase